MNKPFAICQLCSGPIWQGNPAKWHEDGLMHYFASTCAQVREDRAKEEAERLAKGPKQ